MIYSLYIDLSYTVYRYSIYIGWNIIIGILIQTKHAYYNLKRTNLYFSLHYLGHITSQLKIFSLFIVEMGHINRVLYIYLICKTF